MVLATLSFRRDVVSGWGCSDTVLRAWEISQEGTLVFKVSKKLRKCKKMLKSSSKDHFSNVKEQIATKKELLWKAKEEAAKGGSYGVVVQLRRELNVLLDKESKMWKQRARTQWVAKGDKNTRYFHGVATQRKRKILLRVSKMVKEFGRVMRKWFWQPLWSSIPNCLLNHILMILIESLKELKG